MASNKINVGIENKKGYLRLRLPNCIIKGSKRYITTGLQSTPQNLRKAQMIAWDIEDDLINGCFDWTFQKYKLNKNGQVPCYEWDLTVLWRKYSEFMEKQVAETTYLKDYSRRYENYIQRFPSKDCRDYLKIREWLLGNYSVGTTKRVLNYLSACCNWAVESKQLPMNPFDGLGKSIKKPRSKNKIDPFTDAEVAAIIDAFENHPKLNYYVPFVKFLFLTGCRTGEAVGLQWRNVDKSYAHIIFEQSHDSQTKIRKSTKNGESRKFPCNDQLKELLASIKPRVCSANSPVFPAPKGGLIHALKFTNQVWRGCRHSETKMYHGIVGQLVEKGLVRSYRPPYNARHTFITQCLEQGVPVQQIAQWCGNSPEVIFRHYAGLISNHQVPTLSL